MLAHREEQVVPRLLSLAFGLCRRMDAGLEIMLLSIEEQLPSLLENFMRELQQEGIPYRLKQGGAMHSKDVVHYANTHECIVTVLIDRMGSWMGAGDDKHHNPWRKLDCPLVVARPD